jgi:hypothetical protein
LTGTTLAGAAVRGTDAPAVPTTENAAVTATKTSISTRLSAPAAIAVPRF